jgi:hypothetical protein
MQVDLIPTRKPKQTFIPRKGYVFVTFPLSTVRVHFQLNAAEHDVYYRDDVSVNTQQSTGRPFGAAQVEWDKCAKNLGHTIAVSYPVNGNVFNTTDPHRIAAKSLEAVTKWFADRGLRS